jgi:hypothetical protein
MQIIYPQITQIFADYYLKIMPSAFMALKSSYSDCQKFVPITCHCEEPSDEAIFWKTWGIASLRSQ